MYHQIKNVLIFSLILFFAFILSNCKKTPTCHSQEINTGIIIDNFDVLGKCYVFLEEDTFVINTLKEYQRLTGQIDSAARIYTGFTECDTVRLQSIDFDEITLLGIFAQGSGSSVAFRRDVKADTANHTYIYTINVIECGEANITELSMN